MRMRVHAPSRARGAHAYACPFGGKLCMCTCIHIRLPLWGQAMCMHHAQRCNPKDYNAALIFRLDFLPPRQKKSSLKILITVAPLGATVIPEISIAPLGAIDISVSRSVGFFSPLGEKNTTLRASYQPRTPLQGGPKVDMMIGPNASASAWPFGPSSERSLRLLPKRREE